MSVSRIVLDRTLLKVDVDYAGPLFAKMKNGRGIKPIKCFECVFVCTATNAIHLCLGSDFTSKTFFAASQRFASKRGMHQEINND